MQSLWCHFTVLRIKPSVVSYCDQSSQKSFTIIPLVYYHLLHFSRNVTWPRQLTRRKHFNKEYPVSCYILISTKIYKTLNFFSCTNTGHILNHSYPRHFVTAVLLDIISNSSFSVSRTNLCRFYFSNITTLVACFIHSFIHSFTVRI